MLTIINAHTAISSHYSCNAVTTSGSPYQIFIKVKKKKSKAIPVTGRGGL
jgi:hypothetical protein